MSNRESGSNKLIAIGVAVVGGIIVVGMVTLAVLNYERPDASATFISQFGTFSALAISAGASIFGWINASRKIKEVERNTNGRLHRMEWERDTARETLSRLGMDIHGGKLPPTSSIPVVTDPQ